MRARQIQSEDSAYAAPDARLAVAKVTPTHLLVEADGVPLGLPLHLLRAKPSSALGSLLEQRRPDSFANPRGFDPEIVEPTHLALRNQCCPANRLTVDFRHPYLLAAKPFRREVAHRSPLAYTVRVVSPVALRSDRDLSQSLPFMCMGPAEPHPLALL